MLTEIFSMFLHVSVDQIIGDVYVDIIAAFFWHFSTFSETSQKTRVSFSVDTLDALMKVSLNSLGVEFMDWNRIFDTWKTATVTNKHMALSLQEVELDGWFFIISLY